MRYNQNYQCNKCQTEVQSLEAPWFSECHVCGGRAITKTVKATRFVHEQRLGGGLPKPISSTTYVAVRVPCTRLEWQRKESS